MPRAQGQAIKTTDNAASMPLAKPLSRLCSTKVAAASSNHDGKEPAHDAIGQSLVIPFTISGFANGGDKPSQCSVLG